MVSRRELLEAVSMLPPQELVHLCDRARSDFASATKWVLCKAVPSEQMFAHSDDFLRIRVASKVGRDGLTMWDDFVKLVDMQPKPWRYQNPEEGEM